jgi:hypothetical protein
MCIGQEQGLDMKLPFLSLIFCTFCASAVCADKPIGLDSFDRFDYSKAGEFILDNATNLTWQVCSVGQKRVVGEGCQGDISTMGWKSAKSIEDATWRLPTNAELATLIDANRNQNKISPRINRVVFPNVEKTKLNYWTSDSAGASEAWYVNFGTGPITDKADKNSQFAVRLVKGKFVPPVPEVKPPKDIYEFIGWRDDCNHFAGEFNGDQSKRDQELGQTLSELRCDKVEVAEKKLRKKYQGKPDMLKWLNERPE